VWMRPSRSRHTIAEILLRHILLPNNMGAMLVAVNLYCASA